MISFIILLILSFVLIFCLILKIVKIKLPRKIDIAICVVLPFLTVSVFIAMLIECNVRRQKDIKTLNALITIVDNAFSYNRVFGSNEEKRLCRDSLLYYKKELSNISLQDSLITILYGESQDMNTRVNQAKGLVTEQIKRLNRLNDFIDSPFKIDTKHKVDNIHLRESFTTEQPRLNLIFSCRNVQDSVVAIQVTVLRSDTVFYSRQYEYNRVNSVTVPYIPDANEKIELGYITQKGNINNYNYIIYGE